MTHITLNKPAPDITVMAVDGQAVKLSSIWAHGPVLVNFLRHFG